MAACKSMKDANGVVHIPGAALPITCKLQNPPGGVTIALAELFDGTGTPTVLPISPDGQSFTIPNTIAKGNWDLEVRVQGGVDPIPAIHIVEDCDASQRILTITDPVAKMADADVVVQ
jgi:hypothetical protein